MPSPSIWLVGCGNMGGAMLQGWLASGVAADTILVIDPAAKSTPVGVTLLAAPPADRVPDILVLAIKPQMLADVGPTLPVSSTTTVISILAGVEIASLASALPGAGAFVRVMPNMPAAIGEGVSAVFGPSLDAEGRKAMDALVAPLGRVEWVEDESLFHAVTGLSGSGPAFVLRFAEALIAAGVAEGLSPDLAKRLALETLAGTARLALQSDLSPGALVETVRSPNGTTHAGLVVMDGSDFAETVGKTISAAAKRSRGLALAAQKG
jgi:pyrroline-5-carboxylate reductase